MLLRRLLVFVLSAALVALAIACDNGGDSGDDGDTSGDDQPATSAPTPTAAPTRPAPMSTGPTVAGELEVTGIVGAVNTSTRTIQIDRIRGADVTLIAIEPTTSMRLDDGTSIGLGQIRPSDRIIARGQIGDRADTLLAREIEVQEVVPGGAPGGG